MPNVEVRHHLLGDVESHSEQANMLDVAIAGQLLALSAILRHRHEKGCGKFVGLDLEPLKRGALIPLRGVPTLNAHILRRTVEIAITDAVGWNEEVAQLVAEGKVVSAAGHPGSKPDRAAIA